MGYQTTSAMDCWIKYNYPHAILLLNRSKMTQAKRFFNMPRQEKIKIGNEVGPHPQRGWSRVGVEHTSKLRAENLNGGIGDDLTDEKVSSTIIISS